MVAVTEGFAKWIIEAIMILRSPKEWDSDNQRKADAVFPVGDKGW